MKKAQGFGSLWHLATRFAGSLLPYGPPPSAEAWAAGQLLPGEAALFAAMSGPDRRHAIGVARQAVELLGTSSGPGAEPADRAFVAAGLLHDVGKTEARLGTIGRVGATVAAVALGRDKVVAWDDLHGLPDSAAPDGSRLAGGARSAGGDHPALSRWSVRDWRTRMGRYLMHDRIGAGLLEGVGSDRLTSTWAREHHLPERRWSVDRRLGQALKEADGD